MGIISGIIENTSNSNNIAWVEKKYARLLGQDEELIRTYQWIKDLMIFTNYRLIFVETQGSTGKTVKYASFSYKHIIGFEVEAPGDFAADAKLTILITDGMHTKKIIKDFDEDKDIYQAQAMLAKFVGT